MALSSNAKSCDDNPTHFTIISQLKDGEFYVIRLHYDGYKATVVERENNILTLEEAQSHAKLAEQAMLDEMTRWHTLGAFQRMDRRLASNVIDARWVLT